MKTVLINGIEVPAPESEFPAQGTEYWTLSYLSLDDPDCFSLLCDGGVHDGFLLQKGFIWLKKEHAELAAKAYAHKPSEQVVSDAITNPTHYQLLPGVEVIDVRERLLQKIEAAIKEEWIEMSLEQIDAWSRAWEYMTRFMDKGGVDDLLKAENYLHRLLYGEWKK